MSSFDCSQLLTMQQQVQMWFDCLHQASMTCQVLALWLSWLKLCAVGFCSNRGPNGELMFLLPRMDEMHRLHEVIKIDFHTPAIIRNAGRTLAARDVVDILRVYIAVLHRIVGESYFLLHCHVVHYSWCCLLSMRLLPFSAAGVAFLHIWWCLSSELLLPLICAGVAFHQSWCSPNPS